MPGHPFFQALRGIHEPGLEVRPALLKSETGDEGVSVEEVTERNPVVFLLARRDAVERSPEIFGDFSFHVGQGPCPFGAGCLEGEMAQRALPLSIAASRFPRFMGHHDFGPPIRRAMAPLP